MITKNMEARREAFERKYPLLDGMYWDEDRASYAGHKLFWLYQDRWETWNAALDSICVELPQPMPSDDPYASYEGGWNDMRSEAQDAIAAAGVPYK